MSTIASPQKIIKPSRLIRAAAFIQRHIANGLFHVGGFAARFDVARGEAVQIAALTMLLHAKRREMGLS